MRPEPLPVTVTAGVRPRGAQVRALAGLSVCPASSAKQIHAPSLRATLLPPATAVCASGRWPAHRVRRRGAPASAGSTRGGAAAATRLEAVTYPRHGGRGVGPPGPGPTPVLGLPRGG